MNFHQKINQFIYNPKKLKTMINLDSNTNKTVISKFMSYEETDFFDNKSTSRVNRYIKGPYTSIAPLTS